MRVLALQRYSVTVPKSIVESQKLTLYLYINIEVFLGYENELLKDIKFHSIGELRRALDKAIAFYNNERPHMSLNNMTPRQAASCMGKIQKKWISFREKYLENLEIQEGACTFAPQTLNMIERLSAEPIQQKQGLRENYSTSARDKD